MSKIVQRSGGCEGLPWCFAGFMGRGGSYYGVIILLSEIVFPHE
jgi:hypothetical protein